MKQTKLRLPSACLAVALISGVLSGCALSDYVIVDDPEDININTDYISTIYQARAICPSVCSGLSWNHQWRTIKPNGTSVCGTTAGVDVPSGPILNNRDAQSSCPYQLSHVKWNGNWKTIVADKVSACGCQVPPPLAGETRWN